LPISIRQPYPHLKPLVYVVLFYLLSSGVEITLENCTFRLVKHSRLTNDIRYEFMFGISILLSLFAMRRIGWKLDMKSLGLKQPNHLGELILGFLVGAIFLFGPALTFSVIYSSPFIEKHTHFPMLMVLALYLLTNLTEEVFYWGIIFQAINLSYGTSLALVASLSAFGLDHALSGYSLADTLLVVLASGVLSSGAYLATGRLWFPIGLHWGWDFTLSLFHGGEHFTSMYVAGIYLFAANLFAIYAQTFVGIGLLWWAWKGGHWRRARFVVMAQT